MADLSTKANPLDLRNERPDYVEDKVGMGNRPGSSADLSEDVPPAINAGPHDTGSLGIEKPHVTLDDEAVQKAESEGKGYRTL
ncbi:MAG: hypothetical protein AAGK21_12875 [Bacteroidota bacterium]